LKSFAVRSKVKYAPHPYVWMAPAHAVSTGLGIETEGLELPLNELPSWEEAKVKVFPIVRFCSMLLFRVSDEEACVDLEEPRHWRFAFRSSPLRCPGNHSGPTSQ
jgi:hypothetical protein